MLDNNTHVQTCRVVTHANMSVSSPSPYQSFAKILSSYHEQYAEPGPSSVQLDSLMRSDAVLDEEGGLLVALMSAIEET